jgi:DNA repair photolyase
MKEFGSFYQSIDDRKANTWCRYTKRLDTYGCGCQHDCSYCYAKSLLNFRGLWNATEPSVASTLKIATKIKSLSRYEVVKLGGMTDCFQPIELNERNTYRTILWLNHYRINYLIVTKSAIVANDEYLKIYDKSLAHFQISITNTDDKDCLKYEKASVVSKRIAACEKLQSCGFDVSVRLSPLIDSFIDYDTLNSIKCDKILVEFLKVNHWVKKWFDIDYSEYSLKYGGYEHLQLDRKIEIVNKVTGFKQLSVGEYVYDHYIYFRDNVNYNKSDCCNLTLNMNIDNTIQQALF